MTSPRRNPTPTSARPFSLSRTMHRLHRARRRRFHGTRATAILEFAFLAPIVALFLFGIIIFGLLLSFRQNITQAANEGARAGAVVIPISTQSIADARQEARNAARDATDLALESFDQVCGQDGMTCNFLVDDCDDDPNTDGDCITVEVVYDYASNPFLPEIPLLDTFLPDTLSNSATAQINPGFFFASGGGAGGGGGGGGEGGPDDCNEIVDNGCRPLCDDIHNNAVPDCRALPTVPCDLDSSTELPDCGPIQSCDITAGNNIPDCPAPNLDVVCDNFYDNGTLDCTGSELPCNAVAGDGIIDCTAGENEPCDGNALEEDVNDSTYDNGVPTCPPSPCNATAGDGIPDCPAGEGVEPPACDGVVGSEDTEDPTYDNGTPTCLTPPSPPDPCNATAGDGTPDCPADEGVTPPACDGLITEPTEANPIPSATYDNGTPTCLA